MRCCCLTSTTPCARSTKSPAPPLPTTSSASSSALSASENNPGAPPPGAAGVVPRAKCLLTIANRRPRVQCPFLVAGGSMLKFGSCFFTIALLLFTSFTSQAQLSNADKQLARDIFQQLIDINTTHSNGSTTVAAEAMAKRLRDAGFP